jgi:hypothetical protein
VRGEAIDQRLNVFGALWLCAFANTVFLQPLAV